jgi:hypothetical protein
MATLTIEKTIFRKEFVMTGFNVHVYEMLRRVLVFAGTHATLFSPGTLAADLLEKIQAAVLKLAEHSASQASSKGAVKRWVDQRAAARAELREHVEAIYRIARVNGLKQFLMPRSRGDIAIVDIGKSFAKNAEPLKQLFVANHLPEDFIDQLRVAIETLETTINDHTYSKAARMSATAVIDQARIEALAAVKRLDPIIKNVLRNDPTTFGVWLSMRRVDNRPVFKTVHGAESASPTVGPDAQANAASPQT